MTVWKRVSVETSQGLGREAPVVPGREVGSARGSGSCPDSGGLVGTVGGGLGGLPVVLDVPSAGRLLGIGRTRAYRLARSGGFPCRVLRIGGTWRVPTAGVLGLLGLVAVPEGSGLDGLAAPESAAPERRSWSDRRAVPRSVVAVRRVG